MSDEVVVMFEQGYDMLIKNIKTKPRDLAVFIVNAMPLIRSFLVSICAVDYEHAEPCDKRIAAFIHKKQRDIITWFVSVCDCDIDESGAILGDFMCALSDLINECDDCVNRKYPDEEESKYISHDFVPPSAQPPETNIPDTKYYIGDFVGGSTRCFELGERLVDTYLTDGFHERNKVYRDILLFQKEMNVTLDDKYLESILPANQYETYITVKIRYLWSIRIGDTYDFGMYPCVCFEAEATAIRAYLTAVLRLIYARGHIHNEPLPERLLREIYRYYPRSDDPENGMFWKYIPSERIKAEKRMDIPNRFDRS